jgi:hypothetical protein
MGDTSLKTAKQNAASDPAWRPFLPVARSEPRTRYDTVQLASLRKIVGGVISPLLSNIFLHNVLDLWFERDVNSRLRDRSFLIRYADDFVIGFRDGRDARRVLDTY